jgi:transposase-like protein
MRKLPSGFCQGDVPSLHAKIKYLNNFVEQDHRGVKRVTRPMLGFKPLEAAQSRPSKNAVFGLNSRTDP